MNKLSSIAKKLDAVVKIIYWLVLIVSVLSLGMTCWSIYAQHSDPNLNVTGMAADFGYLTLNLRFDEPDMAAVNRYQFLVMALAVIHLPLYCVMLRRVRDILKPLKEQQPFHQTMAKNLKKLAVLIILVMVISIASEFVAFHYAVSTFDLPTLLRSEYVTGVKTEFVADLTPLIFSAALWLLSYIFQYGEELQTLSDETL